MAVRKRRASKGQVSLRPICNAIRAARAKLRKLHQSAKTKAKKEEIKLQIARLDLHDKANQDYCSDRIYWIVPPEA